MIACPPYEPEADLPPMDWSEFEAPEVDGSEESDDIYSDLDGMIQMWE